MPKLRFLSNDPSSNSRYSAAFEYFLPSWNNTTTKCHTKIIPAPTNQRHSCCRHQVRDWCSLNLSTPSNDCLAVARRRLFGLLPNPAIKSSYVAQSIGISLLAEHNNDNENEIWIYIGKTTRDGRLPAGHRFLFLIRASARESARIFHLLTQTTPEQVRRRRTAPRCDDAEEVCAHSAPSLRFQRKEKCFFVTPVVPSTGLPILRAIRWMLVISLLPWVN